METKHTKGEWDEQPSFAIVMDLSPYTAPLQIPAVGKILLKMLNKGLNEIGYEIIRTNQTKSNQNENS